MSRRVRFTPASANLFRVTATVGRTVDGWWRVQQVPTFLLDGDQHGIQTEKDAERFAERMLVSLIGENDETAQAMTCAVKEDR